MKLLLWIVLIAVVLYLLQGKKRPSPSAPRATAPRDGAELMVRCEHCDLYLPASEAISTASGATFCSQAHRALHPPA